MFQKTALFPEELVQLDSQDLQLYLDGKIRCWNSYQGLTKHVCADESNPPTESGVHEIVDLASLVNNDGSFMMSFVTSEQSIIFDSRIFAGDWKQVFTQYRKIKHSLTTSGRLHLIS